MATRKPGQPHKGWKASARGRFLDTSSLVPIECLPAGKPGLCECAACAPTSNNLDTSRVATDAEIRAYLDKLPREQWAYADTMLRARYPLAKDRAVALAKEWLRRALLMVPPRHTMSQATFVPPAWARPS